MGFSIFKPFTNEAQVNYIGPMYSFPMTTNHEMAHQMDLQVKPNVILLDSRINQNDNLYIQYSGYSYAYDIASICRHG
jgi:hypothetical protein